MKNDTNERSQIQIMYGVDIFDPTPLIRIDALDKIIWTVYKLNEKKPPFPCYRLTKGEVRVLIYLLQSSLEE